MNRITQREQFETSPLKENPSKQTLVYELKKIEKVNLLGALNNGKEAVEFVKKNVPDIILMDIDMPVMDGIEATKEIKKFTSNTKIIMLTAHNEKDKVFGAFASGADAYCVKEIKIDELLTVMEIVGDDGIWFDKQIACFIFEILKSINIQKEMEKKSNQPQNDYHITDREKNVLKLISDGLSNSEIAQQLIISKNTVKNHVASIISKLAVKDRTQIAVFALKNNLLN